MIGVNNVYKCEKCGNIVEVLHDGGPKVLCCAKPMEQLVENTVDAAVEKHIPVIEKIDGGVRITVGEVEHPMTEEHYIEWIEVLSGSLVYRKMLSPGEKPVAEFLIPSDGIIARAYCNLHGHWKA